MVLTNIYFIQRNNYIVCEDADKVPTLKLLIYVFDEIIERIWLVILEIIRMVYVFNNKLWYQT